MQNNIYQGVEDLMLVCLPLPRHFGLSYQKFSIKPSKLYQMHSELMYTAMIT